MPFLISQMPLFGKPKSPKELVQVLSENLTVLNNGNRPEKELRKALDNISTALSSLHELLTDKSDTRFTGREPDPELCNSERIRINDVVTEVTHELINLNVIILLVNNLDVIGFESSKHVVELLCHVMHRQIGPYNLAVKHLLANPNIITSLIHAYPKPEQANNYGAILRDACRHEAVAEMVLRSPEFYLLFDYVQSTAFDMSSDALATVKYLLTHHKKLVGKFLVTNYDEFFQHYSKLITSENYVTQRQALRFLGELLLERNNFPMMTRYVADAENLKVIMNLLKCQHRHVAFEAFHCFKVFVANPDKSVPVHTVLLRNQEQLTTFLSKFQTERTEDIQFRDEKEYLIKQIRNLKPLPTVSTESQQSANVAQPPASN